MSKGKNKLTYIKHLGFFLSLFLSIFFVSGFVSVNAETIDPPRQNIDYTITGDNIFGTYNVKTNGDKIFNWNVSLTHNGPGAMHVVTIGAWDEEAGTAATTRHGFSVPASGKVDYKNPVESGSFSFSYDTRQRSCGRVQIDGSFIDERYSSYNDSYLFFAIVIDYGVDCPDVTPPPSPTEYDSQCISISAPSTISVGQTFTGTIVMKNIGANTWTSSGGYKLGSQSPENNLRWGTGRLSLPSSVPTGQSAVFSKTFTVPNTPGTYSFDWKMLRENVTWFGQPCTKSITVLPIVTYTLTLNTSGNGSGTTTGAGIYNSGQTVTATASANTGSTFTGWSGDCSGTNASIQVTMNRNKTCTANFILNTYTLTINTTGNGSGTVTGAGTYSYGQVVTAGASANTGSTFTGWSGDCNASGQVTMNSDKICTATFTLNTYTLTLNKVGNGSGTVTGAGTYSYGQVVTAGASANTGSTFAGWSGDCGVGGQVTMNANKTCTATFTLNIPNTYVLTIFTSGNGSGITTGAGTYNSGTVVTATATANTGSTFTGWSGDCNTSGQVTMNSNKTCTATFTLVASPTANLSISKTSDKATANVGDTVTYTIALTNNGPDNATGV
ncbi:MAG: InlB B-repeat-containing protein, partial [Candidatus Paceibacterota bacterium]